MKEVRCKIDNATDEYCNDCRFIHTVSLGNIHKMCLVFLQQLPSQHKFGYRLRRCPACLESEKALCSFEEDN